MSHPRSPAGDISRSERRFSLTVVCGIVAALMLAAARCPAAPPATEVLAPRFATVAAEAPETWPAGNWNPVLLAEYRQFLRDAAAGNSSAPKAYLERMEYRAVYDAEALRAGSVRCEVRRVESGRQLLDLGTVSLPISDLRWEDETAAIWGRAPDGRTLLLVDRDRGVLHGRWSLRGRTAFDGVLFDLQIPSAVASHFELTVPKGHSVKVSAGVAARPEPAEQTGWERHVVELGGRTRFHITVERTAATANLRPLVVTELVSACVIRSDGAQLQSDFVTEVLDAPLTRLQFRLPSALSIDSANFLGYAADVPLSTSRTSTPEGDVLEVRLPEMPAGQRGTIRLRGAMPVRWNDQELVPLPQIVPSDTLLLSGRLSVQVERPLELKDLNAAGFRQTDIASDKNLSETWTFQQTSLAARMSVRVGLPQLVMSARVFAAFDPSPDSPLLRTTIWLTARSGSSFVVACRIPAEWDVIDVKAARSGTGLGPGLAGWRTTDTQEAGVRQLSIEFPQALTPQSPKEVTIYARREPLTGDLTRVDPTVVPVGCESTEMLSAVRIVPGVVASVTIGSNFVVTTRDDLEEAWGLTLTEQGGADYAGQQALLLRSEGGTPSGSLILRTLLPSRAAGRDSSTIGAANPPETLADGAPTPAAIPCSMLSIDTRIAAEAGHHHVHRVRYDVAGPAPPQQLRFTMPVASQVIAVRVNRHVVPFTVTDRVVDFPLPVRDLRELEVEYRTTAANGRLEQVDHVPLPDWQTQVLSYKWAVTVPPQRGFVVDGNSPSHVLIGSTGELSLAERLLGPLARHEDDEFFNPFRPAAWRKLFGIHAHAVDGDTSYSRDPGRSITLLGPGRPDNLTLRTYNLSAMHAVGWVCLWATALTGVIVRLVQVHRLRRIAAYWLLACLGAAWILPEHYASLAGGCFAGTCFAFLIPREILRRVDLLTWPVWSTETTIITGSAQVAPLLLFCVLGGWLSATLAQDFPLPGAAPSSSPATPAAPPAPPGTAASATSVPLVTSPPASPRDALELLIPLQNGQPIDRVYVNDSLLQQITNWRQNQLRDPAYLLRSARYSTVVSSSGQAYVTADFGVVVFATEPQVPVLFPFAEITFERVDDCLVDGQPARIIPMADGPGVLVQVPGVPRSGSNATESPQAVGPQPETTAPTKGASGGESASAAVPPAPGESAKSPTLTANDAPGTAEAAASEGPSPQPRNVAVQLKFIARQAAAPAAGFHAILPRIVDSTAIFQFESQPPATPLFRGLGAVTPAADAGTWGVDCGADDRLEARWHLPGAEPAPQRRPTLRAVSLVEAGPLRLRVRSRIDIEAVPDNSALTALSLALPPQAVVRDATCRTLSQSVSRRQNDSSARLDLEFNEPLAAGLQLYIEFILPATTLQVPELPFLGRGIGFVHQVGLQPQPGFSVAATTERLGGGEITLLPRERLPVLWRGDPVWSLPDAVCELTLPQPIPFALAAVLPERTAAVEQTGRILRGELEWRVTARVETRNAPVFGHSLIVDPRLQIESLSVEQDGAERLLRSSREGARLNLLVTGGLTGAQTIHLVGVMPVQNSEQTPLPLVRLAVDNPLENDLQLWNASGWAVQLLGALGPVQSTGDAEIRPPEVGTDQNLGRFHLSAADAPTHLIVTAGPDSARADVLTELVPDPKGGWKLIATFHVRAVDSPLRRITAHLSPDIRRFEVVPVEAHQSTETADDGSLRLGFVPDARQHDAFDFTIATPVAAPPGDVWSPPAITVSSAMPGEQLLRLPASAGFGPEGSAELLEPGSAAAEKAVDVWNLQLSPGDELFRITGPPLRLKRRGLGANSLQIPLAESLLWSGWDQATWGTSAYFLRVQAATEFRVRLPKDASVLVAQRGDTLLAPSAVQAGELVVPLPQGGRVEPLTIWWRQPTSADTDGGLSHVANLPQPVGVVPECSLITVVPAAQRWHLLRSGVKPLAPVDYWLERFSGLLDAAEGGLLQPFDVDGPLLTNLRSCDGVLTGLLEGSADGNSIALETHEQYAILRDRWAKVRESMTVVADVTGDQPPDLSSAARIPGAAAPLAISLADHGDRGIIGRLAPGAAPPRFWILNRTVWRGLWRGLVLGLLALAIWKIRRGISMAPFAENLAARPYLGLSLFGLIWWCLLTPSLFGVAMLLSAGILKALSWWRGYRRQAAGKAAA